MQSGVCARIWTASDCGRQPLLCRTRIRAMPNRLCARTGSPIALDTALGCSWRTTWRRFGYVSGRRVQDHRIGFRAAIRLTPGEHRPDDARILVG